MTILFAILFGLVVGSFLNVCIVRLPEGESIVAPRSHCRSCTTPIAWYDNIPLGSWAALRGRCRHCGERIPFRYPLVEALTGLLFGLVALRGFAPEQAALGYALVAMMVVVTFIDLDHFLILDRITWPAMIAAPWIALAMPDRAVMDAYIGMAVGGGLLWAFAEGYWRLRGQEGLGLGDVKLLAVVGGWQGWQAVLFTFFAGAVAGTLVGVVLMLRGRGRLDMEIPFGPFLAFGSLLYLFYGPELVRMYMERTLGF